MDKSMDKATQNKDLRASIVALGFLVLAIMVVAGLKSQFDIKDGAIIVTLLIAPLLVYGVASGRLTEFTGPGGWGAKFREAAEERVDPSLTPIDLSPSAMEAIPKGSLDSLRETIGQIKDDRPIVMTMTLGRTEYQAYAVSEALKSLSQFRNFKFVVFVDATNQVVAYIPYWALSTDLDHAAARGSGSLIDVVKKGDAQEVVKYPGVIAETVSLKTSNAEALDKMEKDNLEALVVVKENNTLAGVIERDRILSRMLLALAKGAKAK